MSPGLRPAILIALGLLIPSHQTVSADLRLSGRTGGRGMGMTLEGDQTTVVKGLKMRSDITVRGETVSTIVDLEAARFIALRPAERQAEVYDMHAAAAPLDVISSKDVSITVTASGRRETRLGQLCEEHLVDMRVNVAPVPSEPLTVVMHGTVWLAPDSPGRRDWTRFYTEAADRGLFFTDPRSARADPGRTRGLTLLFRRLAQIGVIYESTIDVTVEGRGRMAEAMQKMGTSTMTSAVTRVSADPVDDDLFVVPSSYTVSSR